MRGVEAPERRDRDCDLLDTRQRFLGLNDPYLGDASAMHHFSKSGRKVALMRTTEAGALSNAGLSTPDDALPSAALQYIFGIG